MVTRLIIALAATITLAAENRVLLFTLPPNTTHITQPLDRACFAPLKSVWRETCHRFMTNNPGRVITQHDFSQLFSEAWYKAMTMNNIIAGFRVAGICPFARIVLQDKPSTKFNRLAESTGLAFVPLASPARSKRNELPQQLDEVDIPLRQATSISHVLVKPILPKREEKKEPLAGVVLTSIENRKFAMQKEELKAKKEEYKQKWAELKAEKAKGKDILKLSSEKL